MERKVLSWVVCQSSTLDRGEEKGSGVMVYDLGLLLTEVGNAEKEKLVYLEGECRGVFRVWVETQEMPRELPGCSKWR